MRKNVNLLAVVMALVLPLTVLSQSVGINTDGTNPDASAALDIKSLDKGILIPRMTAAQRTSINNPARGLLVFQTDPVPAFCYYNGMTWINLGSGDEMNNTGFSMKYGSVSTLAGGGDTTGGVNPDNIGPAASLGAVLGVAADKKGNIYFVSDFRASLRMVAPSAQVSTVAGLPFTDGYVNAHDTSARFRRMQGIALDAAGNIYVTERNHVIRKITPDGAVTLFAGKVNIASDLDGDISVATFRNPYAITADNKGNFYVTDRESHTIRKIDTHNQVTTVGGIPDVPGLVNTASNTGYTFFNRPSGIVTDIAGNVYVSDQGNHVIRKIDAAGVVTTFAGTGVAGHNDGPLATATFNSPEGIVLDAYGNFYVADRDNSVIRKITPAGIVSTIAGAGINGYRDGSDLSALFWFPAGLTLDAQGNLFVADYANGRIRKVTLR